MKKYLAYLRVSDKKSEKHGTLENQKFVIKNYLKTHPDINIVEWFTETKSGFKERPIFESMKERLLSDHDIHGVIISKLNRIGRSNRQLQNILAELKDNKKELVVILDNIDTTTPQGKLMFDMLCAFNEYDAAMIKERTEIGREKARLAGIEMGRPKKIIDLEEAIKLYKSGMGLKRICDKLNEKTKKNKKYDTISPSALAKHLKDAGVTLRKSNIAKAKLEHCPQCESNFPVAQIKSFTFQNKLLQACPKCSSVIYEFKYDPKKIKQKKLIMKENE